MSAPRFWGRTPSVSRPPPRGFNVRPPGLGADVFRKTSVLCPPPAPGGGRFTCRGRPQYVYICMHVAATCVCAIAVLWYVCMHACIGSMYLYICMGMCMYVCMYVYLYVCMYRWICRFTTLGPARTRYNASSVKDSL